MTVPSHDQPGKHAIDVIVDFLRCLWGYAKEQITREIGAVADLGDRLPCTFCVYTDRVFKILPTSG